MKTRRYLLFVVLSSLLLTACVPAIQDPIDKDPIDNPKYPEIVFYAPVEKNPPNTNLLPAFEGQTRIHGIRTTTNYTSTMITNQLTEPWGIDVLPNGDLAITEKSGSLRIVKPDGTVGPAIKGFPAINANGQGGLLDIAVSPNFETDRMLYFTLSLRSSLGSVSAVGKARLSEDQSVLSNFEVIYEATPYFNSTGHYGSRIVFDKEGYLFVSTGDRQSLQTRNNAQSLDNGHGKILRITTDGQPAPDNPFLNQTNHHSEIYAYGLRNTQGLAIHPLTGDLWSNDMGPQGGDELNLIESSKNYGWPIISYGEEYTGQPIGEGLSQKDGMEQPDYYWDPSIAPSGMTFYTSKVIPEWENNLFIGALRGSHIVRLVIKDNIVIGEERLLEDKRQRFRDIAMGLNGELYAITDSGILYRIGK
ncbi:MAG: glucose dehydrogenase [Firmicutes bacterium HGW-Firmicutes-19]|jgi:glucose/arabinose dehydrogenase|nr:MAG: glucose dehydrogenase [Firmicutes bacterium HGW-Firmicutes-19]